MTLLSRYYLPGVCVEDRSIDVPLDWRGTSPWSLAGIGAPSDASPLAREGAAEKPDAAFEGRSLRLFYRVLSAPGHAGDPLPPLLFLQGGPGSGGPRVTSANSEPWIAEALRHFRVVLPDQRGCGRSSFVDGHVMARLAAQSTSAGRDAARLQADYLKRFLAPSIVRDFEYLRLKEFGGERWITLGQSYGGYLTLCYLSTFPEALRACMTTGGIPPVPVSAELLFSHTVPRMALKTKGWYARYPEDERRVSLVADRLASGDVRLPDGSPFSVRRLQMMGTGLGMKPAPERLHNIFDRAFVAGDGSVADAQAAGDEPELSAGFLMDALTTTATPSNPLYWTLQEFIYADGELEEPIRWAGAREVARHPELSDAARPLMFFGEVIFPWMFEEDPALKPFAAAESLLMEDRHFDRVYDPELLAANEVPLEAAVYFDDLYVDSTLQLDTLSRVGASHAWVTNEFEHDGLHGPVVFKHLLEALRDRGALEGAL